MRTVLSALLTATASLATTAGASANSIVLFGQNWNVQRFDYKQQIQWTNPVAPFNQLGLIRIEGAWWLGNDRMLVSTSHQDQSVPTTYANYILEIQANRDAMGNVTGISYVRTVVANDPVLLGSPFDLRAGGVAVNTTAAGVGAGGHVLAADGGASKMLRAYDINTGALIAVGPLGMGIPMVPPMTEFTDLTYYTEGPAAGHRLFALDEIARKVFAFDLSASLVTSFNIAELSNPAVAPGDPKGIAYLGDLSVWPDQFHGQGGVLLVSMGDQQPGIQAFTRAGVELDWETLPSAVFQTSPTVTKPKIEAIAADPVHGQLFLFMEKGSLVDNWMWVLSPDCNQNALVDVGEITAGTEYDLNGDWKPDVCQPIGLALCAGDGSGLPCPCGNTAPPASGRGCVNSLGVGARLRAVGTPSLANDTLFLTGEQMPNGPVMYIQGTSALGSGTGAPFGDGLLCAGGALLRLRIRFNANGSSFIPAPGDPTLSSSGLVGAPGTRVYQTWYRDDITYCTGAGFDLSNGLEVTWGP